MLNIDVDTKTALQYAIFKDYEDAARLLIEKQPSLINISNPNQRTPLNYAVSYGHCKIVEMLLDAGADIDAQTLFL